MSCPTRYFARLMKRKPCLIILLLCALKQSHVSVFHFALRADHVAALALIGANLDYYAINLFAALTVERRLTGQWCALLVRPSRYAHRGQDHRCYPRGHSPAGQSSAERWCAEPGTARLQFGAGGNLATAFRAMRIRVLRL